MGLRQWPIPWGVFSVLDLREEPFPHIESELHLMQLKAIPLCSITRHQASPSLLHTLKLQIAMWSLLSLLFSELNKPRILSHSWEVMSNCPFSTSVALLWALSKVFIFS